MDDIYLPGQVDSDEYPADVPEFLPRGPNYAVCGPASLVASRAGEALFRAAVAQERKAVLSYTHFPFLPTASAAPLSFVPSTIGVLIVLNPSPTIGRIVLYQRHGSPNGQHKAEPSPAVVTEVNADGTVTLFVMNPNGLYFNKNTVHDEEAGPGTWRWPPRV